jgi:hypothetical protein
MEARWILLNDWSRVAVVRVCLVGFCQLSGMDILGYLDTKGTGTVFFGDLK